MSRFSNDRQPSRARRASGWISNFLATGIVLVATVGVGRQLVKWWRVEAGDSLSPPQAGPVNPTQPLELAFGDRYSLRRMELDGDLADATQRLQAECRAILENADDPAEPPTAAEQRFLARAVNRPPLEEAVGHWQIHQFDGKLPLLVGVRLRPTDPHLIGLAPARVVAWGLAMPTDEEACTLLVYEAHPAASGPSPQNEIPLPTGLRRTLTLAAAGGETTIGLAGASSPRRTTDDFDRTLAAANWTSTGWRQVGSAWHNRYQAHGKRGARIEVQLADDGHGGVVGLLIVHGMQRP